MNISPTTYTNYQSGFNSTPVKAESNTTDPFVKKNQTLHPVINQTATGPVTQTSETGNNPSRTNPANGETHPDSGTTTINGQVLTQGEMRLLTELKQVDTEVRQHEMAHIAAGGRYITSGANFSYKRGPDGKNYAVSGEVGIDTSPVPGDPQATIQKMRQVKSSALAPANPSPQDLKVAANATAEVSKALSELMILQAKEQADTQKNTAFGNLQKASDSYEKVSNLPQEDTSSFQLAV